MYADGDYDRDEVDLQHMPIVVERASSVSSYEDYDDDGWVNNYDEDERVDIVDHFALSELDTPDFKNLGGLHQGPPDVTKRGYKHPAIATAKIVDKYYKQAEARLAFDK